MTITTGTRVGNYEVLDLLGVGGMGEVYRARDTTLKRDVALKVIPEAFARDEERMARFAREAQMLAALNHVNIAAIYGVEQSDGRRALVLELIDGETLAGVIARGPVPIAEAMRVALQIASALEAAHEQNIVHRDLKPANIKINSQGVVKVLDFGLARALEDPATAAGNVSDSPTMTLGGTRAGLILGTAGYMAPEQARGKPVDRRADIWAFGVVLYEMLSGHQAFAGETISDSLAKVLEREPDWTRLPAGTPVAVRQLVHRCLTKNVRDRLQAIGDARTALQDTIANPSSQTEVSVEKPPRWKTILPWAIAPIVGAAVWLAKPAPPLPDVSAARFEVPLPGGHFLVHSYRHGVELSPDGRRIAFVAQTGFMPDTNARTKIYLKSLDQWDPTPIPGTDGAFNPVFSPSGESLAFLLSPQPGTVEIKTVSLAGGAPASVAKVGTMFGMTWGPDGTMVLAERRSGLKAVRAVGGELTPLTELNVEANEVSHRLPHFLPDGSAVLFTVVRHKETTPNWTQSQIWAQSLRTGQRKLLVENGVDARYAGSGWLVFGRMGKLMAIRFDPQALSVSGSPVQVVDGVVQALYGSSAFLTSGAAQFSLSNGGGLAYAAGAIESRPDSELVWITRSGQITPVGLKPFAPLSARLSPDGSQLLFNEYSINADVWSYNLERGGEIRHTSEGQNAYAIWSPDGSRIAFRSDRAGAAGIYLKAANSLDVTALTPGAPIDVPGSWNSASQELAFIRIDSQGQTDNYVMSVSDPKNVRPLNAAPRFDEAYPEFSPDGKWLAYTSNQSGRVEIYVRPYPGPGDAVMISNSGGTEPAWSRDGSEIFYRNAGQMFAVRLQVSGTRVTPARPVGLFATPTGGASYSRSYDVAKDGRFLMRRALPQSQEERQRGIHPPVIRVVLNWTEELRRTIGK